MVRVPLWLYSAVRRPASALSILLVVMLATAAAAAGPMLLRSVEQASLRTTLKGAPRGSADILVSAQVGPSAPVADLGAATSLVFDVTQGASSSGLFAAPVLTAETSNSATIRPAGEPGTKPGLARIRIAARSDGCAAFPLTDGRCPSAPGEVLVPGTLSTVRVGQLLQLTAPAGGSPVLKVVGRYDPARATALLLADTSPVIGEISAPDLVMAMSQISTRRWPLNVSTRLAVRADKLTLGKQAAARRAVSAVQRATNDALADLSFASSLPDLLSTARADREAAAGLILVVTAQVVALSWFGAVVVMRLTARVRAREWALGRLRGLPRAAWLAAVYGEPAVLFVIGGALGLALANLTCRVAVHRYLSAGTTVEPWRAPVLIAAGLALLGLASGLVVASMRSARAPLATLLRDGSDPQQSSRVSIIVEALVFAATAASVYQLVAGGALTGRGAGLALLAPGLIATSVGLLAIRAVAGLVRRRTRRPARTVGGLILWRQLARTPSALQRNIALAIAVALAVFATQLGALSLRNRTLRADSVIGAATVAIVRLPAGKQLRQVVDAADPSGTAAMAVAERAAPSDGDTSRVVAVDTARLAAVSAWRPLGANLSLTKLAALLHPKEAAPITFRGRQVAVGVASVQVAKGPLGTAGSTEPPVVQISIVVARGAVWETVPLGILGPRRATLSAPVPCAAGCRLVEFVVANTVPSSYSAMFTVASLATDTQPASTVAPALIDGSRWRASPTSESDPSVTRVSVASGAGGLHVRVSDQSGTNLPAFAPADVPDPLPVLIGAHTSVNAAPGIPSAITGTGFDDQFQLFSIAGRSPVIPRALDHGVLADLSYLSALSDPANSHAVLEVWIAPGARAKVSAALIEQGVTIVGTQTLAAELGTLGQTGTARAVLVDLALAWLAALLVLGLYLTTQVIDGTRRRQLWEVTRQSGLPRRRMAVLMGVEFALPALIGVALGVLAGLLAIGVAGDRLPLFAGDTVGPPLRTSPAWIPLGVVLGIAAGAAIVAAAASAGAEAWADRGGRR